MQLGDTVSEIAADHGVRDWRTVWVALPVPTYTTPRSGSYAMPSQTAPPPPRVHHSLSQVDAACFNAWFSNGFAGSPGTV